MASFLLLLFLLMIIALAAAVVLLVVSRRGLRNYPSCGKCSADVREAIGSSPCCPVCGFPFAEVGIIAPGRMRRPALLGAGLGLLMVSLAGLVGVMILTPRTASELGATRAEAVKEHLQMLKASGEAEAAQTALEEAMRQEEAREPAAAPPEAEETTPEEPAEGSDEEPEGVEDDGA
jgi:hypothetical protein